jgi:structural maintenance of chromosome 2
MGGKNKYMVNGHTVQQSQVANMFHSVQLNVNNPHFLIMQGRITKVLNMKPPEILGMIEEAAGTRMFETKKQASIKTIEKKQLKVLEITKCIDEEITPTLENLRTERQIYHEWQANNAEYEQLERFCIACDFKVAEDKVRASEQDKTALEAEERGLLEVQSSKTAAAEQCSRQVQDIAQHRDDQMEGEMKSLKQKEDNLSKEFVKTKSLLSNHEETLTAENELVSSLTKQLKELDLSLSSKHKEFEQLSTEVARQGSLSEEKEIHYKEMREKFHNAAAGVANESTAELLSLPEQILAWEKVQRESASKLQTIEQRKKYMQQEVAELKKKNTTQSSSVISLSREIETLKVTLVGKEQQIAQQRNSTSVSNEDSLRVSLQVLHREVQGLRDGIESKQARLDAALRFDFKDPERGFDRSRVKGIVAKLFEINQRGAATALEVVAGGKLSNVVVDNEKTGSLILQKGGLRQRVTLLPLNKITHRVLQKDKIERAKQIAKKMRGSADLALDLIAFDESVRAAMEHIFGGVIVCSSSDIAKSVAFDDRIRVKTVTLEGDSFDPAGTLTGGSTANLGQLLADLHEFRAKQSSLQVKTAELDAARQTLTQLESTAATAKDLTASVDLLRLQLKGKEDKLAESDYSQLQVQIADLETELAAINEVANFSF